MKTINEKINKIENKLQKMRLSNKKYLNMDVNYFEKLINKLSKIKPSELDFLNQPIKSI